MSEGKIYLSKEHGVNPHVTVCPACGKDSGLILTGNAHLYECKCGRKYIGKPDGGSCHTCNRSYYEMKDLGEPRDMKLGAMLCRECEDALKKEKEAGGVPFKCVDCGTEGLIKGDHPFAKMMREKHPGHGVQFTQADCPQCRKGDEA